MRLLVTGGAGSLGSNIIENVGDECEEIIVIDNFATGKKESLPPRSNVQIVEGSVVDAELVNKVFSTFRPTHVIHSAAAYKDPSNWAEDSRTNVIGSINVVRASEAHQVERLVNFQTALCYGRPTEVPIPVTHPLRPFTSYGISKTAGEAFVLCGQTPSVSLRLANVTGPRLAIGPIPAFYKRLKANEGCSVSTTIRDFIDITDFISILKLALKLDSPTGVFNVSTGEGHTISEIFRLVASHLGMPDAQPVAVNPPGADDVAEVILDPSATNKVFGWSAQVSFEETIKKMLRWYDVHGITDVYSHLQEKK
jgi:nucleoside-diphosphate-sugar epimerase